MFRPRFLDIFDGLVAYLGISKGVLVFDLRGKVSLRELREAIASNCANASCMILIDGEDAMFTGVFSTGAPLYMREGVSDTMLRDLDQLGQLLNKDAHARVYVTEDLKRPLESIAKYIDAMKSAMLVLSKRDAKPQEVENAMMRMRFDTISVLETLVEGLHISDITYSTVTKSLNIKVFGEGARRACSVLYLISCTLSSLGMEISKASVSCYRSPLQVSPSHTRVMSLEREDVIKAINIGLVLGLRYGLLLENFYWTKEIFYAYGMPAYPIEPRDLAKLIKKRLAKEGIKDFTVRVAFVEIIGGREEIVNGKA